MTQSVATRSLLDCRRNTMPVLSQYWFRRTDFRGDTEFLSIRHGAGVWAWINDAGITQRSTLVWEREDRELLIDLHAQANTAAVTGAIDQMLGGAASRRSEVRAGWIPWLHVPYHDDEPGRHGELDLLVRIAFDFHIGTPWFCTDADGDISYYVLFFTDRGGRLRSAVDGWSYDYDGGGPFCTGGINDALDDAVSGGVTTLQGLLDAALAQFAERRFDLVYLLPGAADTDGQGSVDVGSHVSLALLPR
ncbi:hypothetical protein ABZV58_18300 [Nocardia sp. NPDC004654]|uniref:hypothetical protein n=1 Tax=Nocardia sp. NPDC004654 TaxID=3154776 RepID=UPI0033A215C2